MRKKGKNFFSFYLKNVSPSVSPCSNSSPSTSGAAAVVSIPHHRLCESTILQKIEPATAMIMKWSTKCSAYTEITSMFYKNKREALRFIECVNDLQDVMYFLASENSASEKLKLIHSLMQIAMKRLQVEFYMILSAKRESSDAKSCSEPLHEVKTVSSYAMTDLRSIAECMISTGYAKECAEIYTTVRRSVVDEWIYNRGVVKLSSNAMDLEPEAFDLRIKNWMKAVNIATATIFKAERVLSHHIFASSGSVREFCFNNTCRDGAMLLFKLPEMIVKSKKSQKNMFRMLDMFSTIADNWTEIESIFSSVSTEAIRTQAFTSLGLLAQWISARLSDYESSFQKTSSNPLSADSGIHNLALQSMDFLCSIAEHQEILSTILDQWPLTGESSLSDPSINTSKSDESPFPLVSRCMERLIFILLCKIDCKARQLNDISLSYLFLANNVHHVLSKIFDSKLRFLLGEEWIAQHESKVKQYIADYKRLAWGKVLSSLPENSTATLSMAEVMEIYNDFDSKFKAVYRKQRSSVVSDFKLRQEIISSLANGLRPKYREFYNAHKIPVRDDICARFTPEDVEYYLLHLFLPASDPI